MSTVYSFSVKNKATTPSQSSEIYQLAGWTVPIEKDNNDGSALYSSSPYPFEFYKSVEHSEETKLKLQKSKEDYARILAARTSFDNKLAELSAPDTKSEMEEKPTNVSSISEADSFHNIPKSYEEIYSISVKNRLKNKEKKRVRDDDGNDDGDIGIASGVTSDNASESHDFSNLKGGEYFSNLPSAEIDVNSTLEFAASVGWVKNDEHSRALKDAFNRDSIEQQSSDPSSDSNKNVRKSFDQQGKKQTGVSSSMGSSSSKSFEYPKYNNSASIGALPPSQPLRVSGEGINKSNGGNSKNNKNNNKNGLQQFRVKSESYNPYLSQQAQFEK